MFIAPFTHMLPLLVLAPSQHANLPDLQTLYTRTHFARVDLCTSMAPMLSCHWPSLDLLASALTPVLRDMEASIKVELNNETGWCTMPTISFLINKSVSDLCKYVEYILTQRNKERDANA